MVKSKSKNRRTKRKSRKNKTRKTKMWKMTGCGHKKNMRNCKYCKHKSQSGGQHFYKPAGPIPGPFVGSSWKGSVDGWPGVNGVGADRNYLAQNMYPTDPQTMMMLGGKKNKKNKTRKSGGGIVPQDLSDLGSDMMYNIGSAYNSLNGFSKPVNPAPYMDQLPRTKTLII